MVGETMRCVAHGLTFLSGKRKLRGQSIPLAYSMTENDQASTQTLTVEAYDEGKWQEGNGANDPDYWGEWMRTLYDKDLKPRFQGVIRTWDQYSKLSRDDREDFDFYVDLKRHFDPEVKKSKNGRPKGTWELTLTYSPKWFQDDNEAQEAFKKAEQRLLKYYADELELYRSVGEFTKDGRAHLHIIYRLGSGGKFTDKNIHRAYPRWNSKIKVGKGVQGGHHDICASVSDYSGYIEKDLHKAWHHYEHNHANDNTRSGEAQGVLEGKQRIVVDEEEGGQAGSGTSGSEDEGSDQDDR